MKTSSPAMMIVERLSLSVLNKIIRIYSFAADMEAMFEWKRGYSVNIASIDAQHQQLFAIAAELHEAMRSG
jgi:hypothetical protein